MDDAHVLKPSGSLRQQLLGRALHCILILSLLVSQAQARPWVERTETDLVVNGKPILIKALSLGNWYAPDGPAWGLKKPASSGQIQQSVSELLGDVEAQRFWDEYRDVCVSGVDLMGLKILGFNCVRVPLHRDLVVDFKRLDGLVDTCRRMGLWVLLELRSNPAVGESADDGWGYPAVLGSADSQQKAIELWTKLAEHYKDNPNVLGYELLDQSGASRKVLAPFYARATAAVRTVDPQHLIFLDATELGDMPLNFDKKLVATFRRTGSDPGRPALKPYVQFRKQRKMPVLLKESAPKSDAWTTTLRRSLEAESISWSFSPYKAIGNPLGITSIEAPPYWEEFARYTAALDKPSEEKARLAPSPDHSRITFRKLLDNLRWRQAKLNDSTVRALGLPEDRSDRDAVGRPRTAPSSAPQNTPSGNPGGEI